MKNHDYYIYILTNKYKNVLYIGVTNDLKRRLSENVNGINPRFTSKYNCKFLVYYEQFNDITLAIIREKELKSWRREKKDKLINSFNPEWEFFNDRFLPSNP